VVLSKGREVVGSGYSRLIGAAAKVTDRGENSGNPNWVNQVSKMEQHYPSRVAGLAGLAGLTRLVGLAETTGRIGKQIGLAELVGLAKAAARINEQIELVGLATWSRKHEVPVRLLTRKAGL
jgi:hypothetical protein